MADLVDETVQQPEEPGEPEKSAAPRLGPSLLSRFGVALALVAILLFGASLRFTGVGWDDNTHLHPDERFITMVEGGIAWPKDIGEYFDTAKSTLNPYNRGYNSFVYGTFPLFLVKFLGDKFQMAGYDQITLIGRVASAVFDLGTILLIFLIGRRLFDRRTGLLASLLTSAAVIEVQQSHFFTFDNFVGFFLVAAFLFAVRVWQEGKWYDYPLMGACLGFAAASKINSAVFALIIVLVALKKMWDAGQGDNPDRVSAWMHVLGWFSLSALTALVVLRIVEPYAFSGPSFFNFGLSKKFLDDMQYVQKLVSGEIDQPPSVQWAGTPPYLFPLRNLILWGMGLPLGLAGWIGLGYGGYRLLVKRDSRYMLLVSWVVFFFWYQGGQMAKTMRYFIPLVPLLSLLGAHLLIRLWDGARSLSGGGAIRRAAPYLAGALTIGVAVGTMAYAYAFTRIYTKPVTRVAATEWIFANIPQGTPIANEHWDDPLPIRWKGRDAGWYKGDNLELYNDDNIEKLSKLVNQLDRTQYIFLSSNRLYGSIPRMPTRYPMTTEYYRLLFSGELGFAPVKEFTSYPDLFGFQINDDGAEEMFSVYDHPKVIIMEKTPEYSPAKVRQLLGAVPLDNVMRLKSSQGGRNGLLMSDREKQTQESGGTWSELYDRGSLANQYPSLVWWLALELIGLLALPLAWRVFSRLPDRGYALSKVLGLLLVSYVAWILPSLHLVPFGPAVIVAGMVAVLALGVALVWRSRVEFWRHLASIQTTILIQELVFFAAFVLFWLIRQRNPDLWHLYYGGEKPMEFAYLNAVARSTFFPPYDPWFEGGYINYYYYGYVIVATLIRLTGIVPSVAFNLAIPSVFGLTAVGLFSFGYNFWLGARRWAASTLRVSAVAVGLGSAVLVLIVGNIDGLIQILEALWKLGGLQLRSTIPGLEGAVKAVGGLQTVLFGGKSFPAFDFWRSTRVIGPESPTPITEFPYFTFLYGDLHPHMIAMPLATLAMGLALAIVWQGRKQVVEDSSAAHFETPSLWERISLVLLAGLVVGSLQVTNSWDYPTYLSLLSAAFLVAGYVRRRQIDLGVLIEAGLCAVGSLLTAIVLFLPFNRAYELFYSGVDPVTTKTSIQHYLVIEGFFIFCVGSWLIAGLWKNRWHRFWIASMWEGMKGSRRAVRRRELSMLLVDPTPWMELLPYAALLLIGIAAVAAALRLFVIALLLVLILLTLMSLFERKITSERLLLSLFVGLAAVLMLGVEFVAIKGDIGRMNTVFKFYLQAWFLLGTASALGVAGMLWQWRSSGAWLRSSGRRVWVVVGVLLFCSVMIYPLAATQVKVGLRFQPMPPQLDGMAYMRQATFTDQNKPIVLEHDYSAIRWLQDRVSGSPVVLEAQIPEYRWGSRVSIYTGLPTVLGWTWHQRQQRSGYQWMIDDRVRDIKTMYESTDTAQVASLLRKYNVNLIYVGDLERAYYPSGGLSKFDNMTDLLSVVYSTDGVTIYEVKQPNHASVIMPVTSGGQGG